MSAVVGSVVREELQQQRSRLAGPDLGCAIRSRVLACNVQITSRDKLRYSLSCDLFYHVFISHDLHSSSAIRATTLVPNYERQAHFSRCEAPL